MEVLHAFGVDWKILMIQIFNFGLVLLLLRRFLYQPLMRMLDERNAKLAKGIEDAARAEEERKEVSATKEGILMAARAEGNVLVETLRKEAADRERDLARAAEEKRSGLMAEAKKKAEEERAYILRESEKEVAQMAVLAAEKILQGKGVTRS